MVSKTGATLSKNFSHRDEKVFPSRRQTIFIAMENDYHRDEKNKSLYSKDSVDASIHRMDFNLHN